MATGLEMMLKSMGLDVPKIIADFEQLKNAVEKNLTAIYSKLEENGRDQKTAIQQNHYIATMLEELCQTNLNPEQQTMLSLVPRPQPPPNPQPTPHSLNQPPQPTQPSQPPPLSNT